MPKYKLMYFDVKGLAEEARWLFALAGQPYEDYRFKEGEWETVKPGFIGATDLAKARGDMIADYLEDLRAHLMTIHKEPNETKKEELMVKFKEVLPGFLGNFEKLLKENNGGDGFFVEDKITWTDVFFACNNSVLEAFVSPNYIDAYPKLKALVQKVVSLPAIADWIETRPVTHL